MDLWNKERKVWRKGKSEVNGMGLWEEGRFRENWGKARVFKIEVNLDKSKTFTFSELFVKNIT